MIDNWCHPSDNGIVDFRTEHGQSAGSARWWLPAPGDESIGSIQRGRKASGGLESWSQCWRGDGAPTAPGTRMEAWNLGKWGPVMVRAAWRGRGRRTAPPHHVTAQRGAYQVPIAGASHAAGSPSPPRQPALVSCRLDNTRILATATLRAWVPGGWRWWRWVPWHGRRDQYEGGCWRGRGEPRPSTRRGPPGEGR